MKGLTRPEWVLGAIEITQCGSKTAKRIKTQEMDSDGDDPTGADHMAAMEQQVTAKSKNIEDDEEGHIHVKAASRSSSSLLDEDFINILYGAGSSSASARANGRDSDEDEARAKGGKRRASASSLESPRNETDSSSVAPLLGDNTSNQRPLPGKPKNKKQCTEHRELERSETVILAADQFKRSLENNEAVMGIHLSKANNLLDKLRQRLTEDCVKSGSWCCQA